MIGVHKGDMMKSIVRFDNKKTATPREARLQRAIWAAFFLIVMALITSGCGFYHGQGETAQERARRHYRTSRLNANQLTEDIDKVLMLDRPSRLTESHVP
jgi:hypothetical protein